MKLNGKVHHQIKLLAIIDRNGKIWGDICEWNLNYIEMYDFATFRLDKLTPSIFFRKSSKSLSHILICPLN
jgi:hypothetical protein